MLLFPYASGQVVDLTISQGGSPIAMAGGLFGLTCLSGGGVYLRALWLAQAGNRIVARLRQQTYQHLLFQDHEFLNKLSKGDLLSRLSSDSQLVQSAVTTHAVAALRGIIISFGSALMLFYTSPTLAALSLSTLPPVFIASRTIGRELQEEQKKVQQSLGDATSLAEQALSGITTVQHYVAELFESHRYTHTVAKAHRIAVRTAHRQAQLEGMTFVAANGAVLAVLGYGGTLVLDGSLSPGDLTGFVLYSFMLAGNMSTLASLYADIARAVAASERVTEILDREPAIPIPLMKKEYEEHRKILNQDPLNPPEEWRVGTYSNKDTSQAIMEHANDPNQQPVSVRIENLTFSYPSRPETPVLDNFSLTIEPGQVVALVGGSGSGKSTVASLMTRLYDVPPNSIFLNDQCIHQDMTTSELREQIAIVSQQPVLFRGTIRENILYGSWDSVKSDEDVLRVAELAHVWEDFASELPQGMDTEVSSMTLSGGQRQRVAIARALLKDSPLMILDEATASLDAQSEYFVQQAMDKLFQQNKTVLSIAHRLSTIRHADVIAVLNKGRIVQKGTFEELSNDHDGAFWNLMKTQLLEA